MAQGVFLNWFLDLADPRVTSMLKRNVIAIASHMPAIESTRQSPASTEPRYFIPLHVSLSIHHTRIQLRCLLCFPIPAASSSNFQSRSKNPSSTLVDFGMWMLLPACIAQRSPRSSSVITVVIRGRVNRQRSDAQLRLPGRCRPGPRPTCI